MSIDYFNSYFEELDKSKKELYERVFKVGFFAVFIAIIMCTAFLIPAKLCSPLYLIGVMCGVVVLFAGYLTITSVPTKEIDLDTMFDSLHTTPQLAWVHTTIRCVVIILLLGAGGYGLFSFPFFHGLPPLGLALWTISVEFPRERSTSTTTGEPASKTTRHSHFIAVCRALPVHANPRYLSVSLSFLIYSVLWVAGFNLVMGGTFSTQSLTWVNVRDAFGRARAAGNPSLLFQVLLTAAGVLSWGGLGWALIGLGKEVSLLVRGAPERRGWRSALFFRSIGVAAGVVVGAFVILVGGLLAFSSFSVEELVESGGLVQQLTSLLVVVLLSMVALWGPCGGPRWCFVRVARRFEKQFNNTREQMSEKGGTFAQLVGSEGCVDWALRLYWVKRESKREFKKQLGAVQRNFWVLGHIVERKGDHEYERAAYAQKPEIPPYDFLLRVWFAEDESEEWGARFSGDSLVLTGDFNFMLSGAAHKPAENAEDFYNWKERTFGKNETFENGNVGGQNESVVIRVRINAPTIIVKNDIETTLANMRGFTYDENIFTSDNLFKETPRELRIRSRNAEKTCSFPKGSTPCSCGTGDMFAKSIPVEKGDIHFFMSHAWDDPHVKKTAALKAFMGSFGAGHRLWFDKVCINMCSDVEYSKAIASLPVCVGYCKQLLVLLGPNYLQRLWCVWEVHSLFAYCIKELAVERVVVLWVDADKEAKKEDAGWGKAVEVGATPKKSWTTPDTLGREVAEWTLDDAHCFDPNEELKLRRAMVAIGPDRFAESVRCLAECEVRHFPITS